MIIYKNNSINWWTDVWKDVMNKVKETPGYGSCARSKDGYQW